MTISVLDINLQYNHSKLHHENLYELLSITLHCRLHFEIGFKLNTVIIWSSGIYVLTHLYIIRYSCRYGNGHVVIYIIQSSII